MQSVRSRWRRRRPQRESRSGFRGDGYRADDRAGGHAVTPQEDRPTVAVRYTLTDEQRAHRRTTRTATDRRNRKSRSVPSTDPPSAHATISGAPCHPLGPNVNPAIVPAFSLMHPCRPSPPPSQAIRSQTDGTVDRFGSDVRRGMRVRGQPPRGTRPDWVTSSVSAWCAPKAVQTLTVPSSTRAQVLIVE